VKFLTLYRSLQFSPKPRSKRVRFAQRVRAVAIGSGALERKLSRFGKSVLAGNCLLDM
jgi:hypothetical protein